MQLKEARWQKLIIIVCDVTERMFMTQSKHLHHHWSHSDQLKQVTYNVSDRSLSDDDRGRCCLHQGLRERMRRFQGFQRQSQSLHFICSRNFSLILLLSFVSVLLCWLLLSVLEPRPLTCSIHTVWQNDSVYKTIPSFLQVPTKKRKKNPLECLLNVAIKAKAVNVF